MTQTFFFYDLETTGFNSREARIVQFAGQRTSLDLKPIGNPVDKLIKITEDILPDPGAVLVTGITPQATLKNGISEVDFLKVFNSEVNLPGTIFVGFNNIRFDDEFIRFIQYRNFYEPYEWQWKDGRLRWDMLDVARMTRALRPLGIKWPFDSEGNPSNRLEYLAEINNLIHIKAHDALSDANATVAVAQLIMDKQLKLFSFLLQMRSKDRVKELVNKGEPFIYTSGKYDSEFEKTTVVASVGEHPKSNGALVYDLRFDPTEFSELSPQTLASYWKWQPEEKRRKLPVKTLQFNRSPAIAPLSTLDKDSQERLKIDLKKIHKNYEKLLAIKNWPGKLYQAIDILDEASTQTNLIAPDYPKDNELYEGFLPAVDKNVIVAIQKSQPENLDQIGAKLSDQRLKSMLPLYKARNFRDSLTPEEVKAWEKYRVNKLFSGGPSSQYAKFVTQIQYMLSQTTTSKSEGILKDLLAYGESVKPSSFDEELDKESLK
ncbi:MAG TPA: exodeoxyribonuclease I [Candidatus Saccharimonadales bacterium]|nr:exodeoxyribonuclease I [Candidatus Saccharimonadales bacterium]